MKYRLFYRSMWTFFEWWVDYETKFIRHIDKYIFKNLALDKIGANWDIRDGRILA